MIKIVVLTLILPAGAYLLSGQSIPLTNIRAAEASKGKPIPSYLVYRHFMAWALSQEDNTKVVGGADNNDKLSSSLKDARLEIADLDSLHAEAQSMKSDLDREDAMANLVVKLYRNKSKRGGAGWQATSSATAGNPSIAAGPNCDIGATFCPDATPIGLRD